MTRPTDRPKCLRRPRNAITGALKSLLAVAALTICAATAAPSAFAAGSCPNEQLRAENSSTALPDCRAYELVTPDLNHAALNREPAGLAAADGETMAYTSIDAPENAKSASALHNFVRASRNPITGWSGTSISPPLPAPISAYQSYQTQAISSDLSSTFEFSDQPLSAGSLPSGQNAFVGREDGTFHLVTAVGAPLTFLDVYGFGSFIAGTADFSHVFFEPFVPQLPSDTAEHNTYSWSEAGGLKLLGILPNETPAPEGASLAGTSLPAFSADGNRVAFQAQGNVYLRTDESETIEASLSQRTVPDPNPPPGPNPVGVTASGAEVLFTSKSELTDDANTGQSAGSPTDAGNDLYSYDTVTGHLTDLTPDSNPDDLATGANVVDVNAGGPIVAATPDGSYFYFMAGGGLAAGATPGHKSLYLLHEGHIQFVLRADNVQVTGRSSPFYVTPDGQHVAFTSTDSLTGYDNTDPVTGQPHDEVFLFTLGAGLRCASCRANGTRPTGDSTLPLGTNGPIRLISQDGSRLFFHSTDAVVPQASSGLQQVFEYAEGRATPISRVDGPSSSISGNSATFLDASASGNDVFYETYDEPVPNPDGGDDAVYDARVDGGFPIATKTECSGSACRGPLSAPPAFTSPSSTLASPPANVPSPPAAVSKPTTAPQSRAAKLAKALKACRKKPKRKRLPCQKSAHRKYGRGKR